MPRETTWKTHETKCQRQLSWTNPVTKRKPDKVSEVFDHNMYEYLDSKYVEVISMYTMCNRNHGGLGRPGTLPTSMLSSERTIQIYTNLSNIFYLISGHNSNCQIEFVAKDKCNRMQNIWVSEKVFYLPSPWLVCWNTSTMADVQKLFTRFQNFQQLQQLAQGTEY